MSQGTYIHGIAASEAIDTSNEILKMDGLDISTLAKDGVFNYEHNSHLAGHVVGKVLYAKKIYSEEDCENPLERKFWRKIQLPFLYVVGELFDGVGHTQASEVAAMLRYDAENPNRHNLVNFSIEGATLESKKGVIKEAVARKVTITTHPANKTCVAELLSPQEFQMYISKKIAKKEEDNFQSLMKAYSLSNMDTAPEYRGSPLVKKMEHKIRTKQLLDFLQKRFNVTKAEAIFVAKYYLKKTLAEQNMLETYELLSKAKYDKLFPPEQRKEIREKRREAHRDILEEELTTEPGVSETGIEVRRADKRNKGNLSHGYGRIMEPEKHRERALKYIKNRIKFLNSIVKKSENLAKASDADEKYFTQTMDRFRNLQKERDKVQKLERAREKLRQRHIDLIQRAVKFNVPIPTSMIFGEDMYYDHSDNPIHPREAFRTFARIHTDLGSPKLFLNFNHSPEVQQKIGISIPDFLEEARKKAKMQQNAQLNPKQSAAQQAGPQPPMPKQPAQPQPAQQPIAKPQEGAQAQPKKKRFFGLF